MKDALKFNPDIVTIMLGSNDSKPGNWVNKDRFINDYKTLIHNISSLPSRPKIYLCYPPYVPGAGNYGINEPVIREEMAMINKIAIDEGLEVIDTHSSLMGHETCLPDKVHPNFDGATWLAKTFYKALKGTEFTGPAPTPSSNSTLPTADAQTGTGAVAVPTTVVTEADPVKGPFEPSWNSLASYKVPQWFADAKFGIWAHWGPQCVPEVGDWFARSMYQSGTKQPDGSIKDCSRQYNWFLKNYGHPSKLGFKDICNNWHAEKWEPEKLLALYKRAGAQYFVAMANHHDNFDNWDSTYQPWNSVKIGPHKDLIGGWAKAARAEGLRFGVSIHASHAWSFYEPAQGSDPAGPLAGVSYDGKLTKADGKGTWWDGLDPQDLYAQNHKPGAKLEWEWNPAKGSSVPDVPYMLKFYRRTLDLIDKYQPDLVYFDDSVLPFHGVTDEVGLKIAAHYYNSNMQRHDGRIEAVINTKKLDEEQRKCLVMDIERGGVDKIQPFVWQTDTCIGDWHYNAGRAACKSYTTAPEVLQTLADTVSKNGNLLLSIPVRGNGSIDDVETAIVEEIAAWMTINHEAIFATHPWSVYGESDKTGSTKGKRGQNRYSAADIRFTTSGKTLYAIALNWPTDGVIRVTSLAEGSTLYPGKIGSVELLGAKAPVSWQRTGQALEVKVGSEKPRNGPAVLKISS